MLKYLVKISYEKIVFRFRPMSFGFTYSPGGGLQFNMSKKYFLLQALNTAVPAN
jgi:hypothetical protein